MAQIAPGYGVVLCDLDGDGNVDLFLAQNFFGPQIECCPFDGGLGQLLFGDGKGGFKSVPHRFSGIVVSGDAKSATIADWNGDGKPDLAVTVNNGATAAFANQSKGQWLRVILPVSAPGARVTLRAGSLPPQTVEVAAGSGYLGQSSNSAWFGLGASKAPGVVRVVWPDGTASETPFDGRAGSLRVQPQLRQAGR